MRSTRGRLADRQQVSSKSSHGLQTSGRRKLQLLAFAHIGQLFVNVSACTHCQHLHLEQRKALPVPSLTHMGKILLTSHGSEALFFDIAPVRHSELHFLTLRTSFSHGFLVCPTPLSQSSNSSLLCRWLLPFWSTLHSVQTLTPLPSLSLSDPVGPTSHVWSPCKHLFCSSVSIFTFIIHVL